MQKYIFPQYQTNKIDKSLSFFNKFNTTIFCNFPDSCISPTFSPRQPGRSVPSSPRILLLSTSPE